MQTTSLQIIILLSNNSWQGWRDVSRIFEDDPKIDIAEILNLLETISVNDYDLMMKTRPSQEGIVVLNTELNDDFANIG
jgi:hypothetical protein